MKKCCSRSPRRLQKKSVRSSWPPTFHVYHYLTLSSYTLIFALGGTNLCIKRRCFMASIHFHFCQEMIYFAVLINATRDLMSTYLIYIYNNEIMGKSKNAQVCVFLIQFQ